MSHSSQKFQISELINHCHSGPYPRISFGWFIRDVRILFWKILEQFVQILLFSNIPIPIAFQNLLLILKIIVRLTYYFFSSSTAVIFHFEDLSCYEPLFIPNKY